MAIDKDNLNKLIASMSEQELGDAILQYKYRAVDKTVQSSVLMFMLEYNLKEEDVLGILKWYLK